MNGIQMQTQAQRNRIAAAAERKHNALRQIDQAERDIRDAEENIAEARGILAGIEFASKVAEQEKADQEKAAQENKKSADDARDPAGTDD